MANRLHHLGTIVRSIAEARKVYDNLLGITPRYQEIKEIPAQGLRLAGLRLGDIGIELLEPSDVDSRFSRFLRERGEGLFHLNIFTDDFDTEVKTLKDKGFTLEEYEEKAMFAGHTLRLAWLKPEDTYGVWIELVDEKSAPKEVT